MIYSNLYDLLNDDISITHLSSHKLLTKREIRYKFVCLRGMRPHSRFFLVLNGETYFTFTSADGTEKNITAVKDDIVYLPSDIEYSSEWNKSYAVDYISLEFSVEDKCHEPVLMNDELFVIAHDKYGIFRKRFDNIYSVFTAGTLGYKLKCRSMFYDLLLNIAMDGMKAEYKNPDNSIYNGVLYIENNYMEDISVSELARMSNMCETSFRMKFSKLKGMSPIEYKNYLRIKKAAELLRNEEYTVSEAAESVNIPDICYFSKLFKRHYGMSPREYKRK